MSETKATPYSSSANCQEPLLNTIQYLDMQVEYIVNDNLRRMCQDIINHDEFKIAQASTSKHHVYPGGLRVHTAEVLNFALAIARAQPGRANLDIIRTAVIFHDFAKIYEQQADASGKVVNSPYRESIRHVSGSHAEFVIQARKYGLDRSPLGEAIQHCILSHHGRQEWGSPVEPQTFEAYCIHFADMMSALFGAEK